MSDNHLHLSIEHWLEKLELLIYNSFFKDYNGVEEILWMSERELKNIGINNGSHRARISSSLAILKDKYERTSRYNQTSPSHNGNNLSVGSSTMSPTSISPIRREYFEKSTTGVRSWPSTKPSSSQSTSHSSPRSSMEGYPRTETSASELRKSLERELSLDSSDLRSHAWYHGTILRQRAEELVSEDGDFLVRDCISQPGDFVITCKWKNLPLHFIIKKVILQPDTVYERIQYCFEKESFDSIPDYITYYVGSKCPLSESSGVIISRPVNRVMPLSYYSSRYGIQCQIHYVAKALEQIPSAPPSVNSSPVSQLEADKYTAKATKPKQLLAAFEEETKDEHLQSSTPSNTVDHFSVQKGKLVRVGSDPILSPNTERRTLEPRPNSGLFNSDTVTTVSLNSSDKPPPKPSRVPSKRCAQRPFVIKRERKSSDDLMNNMSTIPIPGTSLAHASFQRQISETRFSFLDRPSISSGGSTPDMDSVDKHFAIPKISTSSSFEPQSFRSNLLAPENSPLEAPVLAQIRTILLGCSSRTLACHLTRVDLEMAQHFQEVDLGLGVTSGLELLLLPQGEQMQKNLLERTESLKLLVAVLILTAPEEDERVKLLSKWIEIAMETKTALGNFYGFTSIMLGLTLPEIQGLHSTWLTLRHSYTEVAFVFETKLRPTFKALHNATGLEPPNTCFPYILSLIIIFQHYLSGIQDITNQSNTDFASDNILDVDLPGSNSTDDFGLQLLADHLEIGRNTLQQIPLLRTNGHMSLQDVKYDSSVLDIFKTEFHLRMLWGFRGSVVCSEDRHKIFQKVVNSLYKKCTLVSS